MTTPARSRQRQGTSGPTPRAARTVTAPPRYQPPTQPLNDAALQRLRDFSTSSSLGDLKKHISALNNLLALSAANINDRYSDRAEQQAKRRARAQESDGHGEISGAAEAEAMRVKTDELTAQLEGGVRAGVDAKAKVEAMESALKELHENVARGGGIVAPTQSTLGASQFRRNRRTLDDDEDEDEEGEREATEIDGQGLVGAMKKKIGEHETKYSALSLTERLVQRLPLHSNTSAILMSSIYQAILPTTPTQASSVSCMTPKPRT